MTLIAQQPFRAYARWSPAKMRAPAMQDHDLPVLAKQENPTVSLDWDPLLAAGVQPALVLGAERRWQGRR